MSCFYKSYNKVSCFHIKGKIRFLNERFKGLSVDPYQNLFPAFFAAISVEAG